jgi:hypothetical protein
MDFYSFYILIGICLMIIMGLLIFTRHEREEIPSKMNDLNFKFISVRERNINFDYKKDL